MIFTEFSEFIHYTQKEPSAEEEALKWSRTQQTMSAREKRFSLGAVVSTSSEVFAHFSTAVVPSGVEKLAENELNLKLLKGDINRLPRKFEKKESLQKSGYHQKCSPLELTCLNYSSRAFNCHFVSFQSLSGSNSKLFVLLNVARAHCTRTAGKKAEEECFRRVSVR